MKVEIGSLYIVTVHHPSSAPLEIGDIVKVVGFDRWDDDALVVLDKDKRTWYIRDYHIKCYARNKGKK